MTNEANMGKLAEDLRMLARDAEAMLQATTGQTGEKMTELRGRLAATIESAKTAYRRLEENRGRRQGRRQNHPRTSV